MTRRLAVALLLPALALTACGGGSSEPRGGRTVAAEGPPGAQTVAVVADERKEFVPSRITARTGRLALTMTVEGGVPHDLVFDEDTIGEDLPVVTSGSRTSTFEFPTPGTYDFVCTLHAGMDGTVVVS